MPREVKLEPRLAPLYWPSRRRVSTRESGFDLAQKVGFWFILGFDLSSFVVKNQFVFSILKC